MPGFKIFNNTSYMPPPGIVPIRESEIASIIAQGIPDWQYIREHFGRNWSSARLTGKGIGLIVNDKGEVPDHNYLGPLFFVTSKATRYFSCLKRFGRVIFGALAIIITLGYMNARSSKTIKKLLKKKGDYFRIGIPIMNGSGNEIGSRIHDGVKSLFIQKEEIEQQASFDMHRSDNKLLWLSSGYSSVFSFLDETSLRRCRQVSKDYFISATSDAVLKRNISFFGKQEWEKYFGEIGEVPPLPSNIIGVINAPCPIWPNKKIKDTHVLTLIPKTINGESLTIELLNQLARAQKASEHATGYSNKSAKRGALREDLGDVVDMSVTSTHWILMTKNILPASYERSYDEKQGLISWLSNTTQIPYQLPDLLSASIVIFMHYIDSGEWICTSDRFPHFSPSIGCVEQAEDGSDSFLGGWHYKFFIGFNNHVHNIKYHGRTESGVCALWKL